MDIVQTTSIGRNNNIQILGNDSALGDRLVRIGSIEETKLEDVKMDGVFDTKIQWLIDDKNGGINFAMRRFVIAPGGIINLHTHDWEHEVYVISGEGEILSPDGNRPVRPGNVVLVQPNEPHGFKNKGLDEFIFICIIPLKSK
jgi:quercetin dioxygenase-like cupin family protein